MNIEDLKIPNVLNNRQLYKKAYLIEFYGKNPSVPEDVFTFSVPPESEELTYSQRKTETKTFGGLHVDDYGTDAAKISLSGSTINQALKMVYGGNAKGDKCMSGEQEIYYFRDLILKYKAIDFLNDKENSNAKIIIYDLSKNREFVGDGDNIYNYWQAFPGDFKIRRSNDRPHTYKYQFEFTGVTPDDSVSYGKFADLLTQSAKHWEFIEKAMESLRKFAEIMETANEWWDKTIVDRIDDVLAHVRGFGDLFNLLGKVMTKTADSVLFYVGSVGRMSTNVINTGTYIIQGAENVVSGATDMIRLPRSIQLKALNIGLEIQNATKRLLYSTFNLTEKCRTMLDFDFTIPDDIKKQYDMEGQEIKDMQYKICNGVENSANELAAIAKSSEIPDVTLGEPNPVTGLSAVKLSYGYTSVMLKSTDSLESLANEHLGDPNKGLDIATYNGIKSLDDLKPGDIIKIPKTTHTTKMANNLIYARREDRDNYGRDIKVIDKGFIVTSNTGDYELAQGVENLTQAVLLRLRESNAKRIRIQAYGIRANVGDTAGVVYIMTSIRNTLSNEPRIASIENIWFRLKGDCLDIRVSYKDINNISVTTTGRV